MSNSPLGALPAATSAAAQRNASLALALATVFWGSGFTWAKIGGQAVQQAAGLPPGALFGPIFLLAWRFTVAAALWFALFPEARRGWTWRGIGRGAGIGLLLSAALVFQHLGLDATSEAVSAFLTSLTILFVPILVTFALRKPPRPALWIGVALATAGVWVMTGASPSGFGRGEWLGLGCALSYSFYILVVNSVMTRETPWRMTGAQFVTVTVVCFLVCAACPGGAARLTPGKMAAILAWRDVWLNMLLLALLATIAAFGLLTHFQPRLDPTRAALLYLLEPIMAVIYAAIAVHHYPTVHTAIGAAMILVANVTVELLSAAAPDRAAVIMD